jgi:hypothetical protein
LSLHGGRPTPKTSPSSSPRLPRRVAPRRGRFRLPYEQRHHGACQDDTCIRYCSRSLRQSTQEGGAQVVVIVRAGGAQYTSIPRDPTSWRPPPEAPAISPVSPSFSPISSTRPCSRPRFRQPKLLPLPQTAGIQACAPTSFSAGATTYSA